MRALFLTVCGHGQKAKKLISETRIQQGRGSMCSNLLAVISGWEQICLSPAGCMEKHLISVLIRK